jgi:hypothetical protein
LKSWLLEEYQVNYVETSYLTAEMLFRFLSQDKQYKISGSTAVTLVAQAVSAVSALRKTVPTTAPDTKLGDAATDADAAAVAVAEAFGASDFIQVDEFPLFLREYYRRSLALLLPDRVLSLEDIAFIPRPAHIPTRYVGSWICPCLGAAVIMVSQYVNYLTVRRYMIDDQSMTK